MELFNKIFKYICKLCFALVLTPTLIISLNYLTDDAIIKMVSSTQNSNLYKDFFNYTNPCDPKVKINKKNETVFIKDTYFTNSLGSCYVDKLNDVDLVEIDLNFGGRTTSALILSREIKKNNIDVKIKGECYSACVDVLMHGNERLVCDDALVGIHQQSAKMNYDWLNVYLMKNNEYSMKKYKEFGLDVDLILEIINKTPSEEMYELSNNELLKTGIATKIISCKNV